VTLICLAACEVTKNSSGRILCCDDSATSDTAKDLSNLCVV